MGQATSKTRTKAHRKAPQNTKNRLPERLAGILIDGVTPTLRQADGLNVHIRHEDGLNGIGGRLMLSGFVVLGHIVMKTESELERFFEQDFMHLLEDAIERKRMLKRPAEELELARREGLEVIPRQVAQALDEIRLALGRHGLEMGMRVLHWDNMRVAA